MTKRALLISAQNLTKTHRCLTSPASLRSQHKYQSVVHIHLLKPTQTNTQTHTHKHGRALTHRRAASSWVSALAFRCSVVSWTVSVALSFASSSLSLPVLCSEAAWSSASFRHTLSCSSAFCFCLLAYTHTHQCTQTYIFPYRNTKRLLLSR